MVSDASRPGSDRPLILLTNDDGIASPGLLAAAAALDGLGDLLIVAPATQQTGMGRSSPSRGEGVTTEQVLMVNGRELTVYAVPGSPAQAVTYGTLVVAPRRPDLAVSGINYGENLGTSVTISGTVGAALEAASLGIPGLAVSLETAPDYHYHHGEDVDWQTGAFFTRKFAAMMLAAPLPLDVDVLKVDIPDDATPGTPWRVTRQSRQGYYETFRVEDTPDGQPVRLDYRVAVQDETLEPDSDVWAFMRDRVVAVVPLSVDLTSRTSLPELEAGLRRLVPRQG